MAYQVIARKYRPQRFSDVVGQEHVTQTLTNAIAQQRIAHAYLFVGPRGTGKTTVARIFAKCLNCKDGPKVDFADDDPNCIEITEGRSLDVLEIDGASNRGIEEVRALRETVKYAPANSRFKIYIIDEVHMLTKEAFNALLKTLEEPPSHVKFMFATTEADKILPTILSRCQRFDLRRIPVALIVRHLAHIAKQEKVSIDEPALLAIARGADGGMRDAESALDQLISFCGDKIVEEDVLSMFGLAAQKQLLALVSALLQGQPATLLKELDALARHGKDLSRLLGDLLNQFRNLLIYTVSNGDLGLLEISETEAAHLRDHAKLTNESGLTRILEVLTDAESGLREAASKKIFLEVALLKALQARNSVSIDALLEQLKALQGGQPASGPTPAPAPTRSTPKVQSTHAQTTHSQVASEMAAADRLPSIAVNNASSPAVTPAPAGPLAELWQRLMDAVGQASAFTRTYLVEARPVTFERSVLTIGFDPEFSDQLDLVNNSRTHGLLQTKLQELGHPNSQIRFVLAEGPEPRSSAPAVVPASPVAETIAQPQPPAPPPKRKATPIKLSLEEFKNDPLIQHALELFKGTIVEVRT
jgi:DNA polymerase-3 subunit gamma/tau